MHSVSGSVLHSPSSQFKPDDSVHHVFRRYYPLLLPPSVSPITHVHHSSHHGKGTDGCRGIERRQMTKYCPLRLSIFFDVLFRLKVKIPFHYCTFIFLLFDPPPPTPLLGPPYVFLLYVPVWAETILSGKSCRLHLCNLGHHAALCVALCV